MKRRNKLLLFFPAFHPIDKLVETGIHKHQYFDYQMTTHASRNAMHGYLKHLLFPQNNQHADYRLVNPYNTAKRRTWVPEAFTLSQKIVNALIIGSFTHTP